MNPKPPITCLLALLLCCSCLFGQNEETIIPTEGVKQYVKSWKKAEPFAMSGGIGTSSRFYNAWNIDPRQPNNFWMLNAQANISLYKIHIPFSALLTFNQFDLTLPNPGGPELRQRLNNQLSRIGFSPQYKWVTTHFGHRNMNFSRYTLNDITFLGAGVEATPGNFRLGAMYGRLAQAEPIDLSLLEPNVPVFERLGYSFKVGYGTDEDFIDLIVLKAWDDPNSLSFTDPQQVFAAENAVFELHGRKTLFGKFQLYAEYARSALMDDVNADPIDDTSNPFPSFLFDARARSTYSTAFDGGLDYNGSSFGLGLQYTRVEPDYTTFGAYFFNSDIENYLGRGHVNLLENRLNVFGSLGLQRDNLNGQKQTTINRVIGSANVNYVPDSKWNLGLNYSNYNSSIDYLLNPELDSLNVVVVTQDLGLTVNYRFPPKGEDERSITFSANRQNITDNITNPVISGEAQMLNLNLVHSWRFAAPKLGFSANLNFNRNNLANVNMNRWGAGVGVNKILLDDKINLGGNMTFYRNTMSGLINNTNTTIQLNGRLNYQINKSHALNFNILVMSIGRSEDQLGQSSFTEMLANLGYRYSFQWRPFKKEQANENF